MTAILKARYFQIFAFVWALVGFGTAISGLSRTSGDARSLVTTFSVLGPLSALGAAVLIRKGTLRWAGVLLVLSVATPTYFAWPINIPALLVGLLLLGGLQLTPMQRTPAIQTQQESYLPIFDFPPDTPAGNVFTVILLTAGNLVLPFISYVWGLVRLTQTKRWSGFQKAGLLLVPLLFPLAGLGLRTTSTKSVRCVTGPGTSCSNVVSFPATTLLPVRSPNVGTTPPSAYRLDLVGQSVTVGVKFRVQQQPVSSTSDMRGGYYWLSVIPSVVGVHRALLWSDKIQGGVPGGSTDPNHWDMLAFGVIDPGPDTLMLPLNITAGNYQLCTANSLHEACMNLIVTDAK